MDTCVLFACLIISLSLSVSSNLIDFDNFLSKTYSDEMFQYGAKLQSLGLLLESASYYEISFNTGNSYNTAHVLELIYESMGSITDSLKWKEIASQLEKIDEHSIYEMGLAKHNDGDYSGAILEYSKIIQQNPSDANIWYHIGVSCQHQGDIVQSINAYYRAITLDPTNTRARLNLAAMYQKFGDLSDAITHYRQALADTTNQAVAWNLVFMIRSNLAAAYIQIGRYQEAMSEQDSALSMVQSLLNQHCSAPPPPLLPPRHSLSFPSFSQLSLPGESPDCYDMRLGIVTVLGHKLFAKRAFCDWHNYEQLYTSLMHITMIQASRNATGPLLPFDTFLLPVTLPQRLSIAKAVSSSISVMAPPPPPPPATTTNKLNGMVEEKVEVKKKLHIGLISFDFSAHPTCQLIVALLDAIRSGRKKNSNSINNNNDSNNSDKINNNQEKKKSHHSLHQLDIYVYSYGKNDHSLYRQRIEELAYKFRDMAAFSTEEAVQCIQQDHIDILLDLQLHTLGNRLEITASRPVPVQVNYLVFPGTSGASFINYIVADPIVISVEYASTQYSEKLLLLPPTYQISSPGIEDTKTTLNKEKEICNNDCNNKAALRRRFGLPPPNEVSVLCNFNKIDKISSDTFAIWMKIMHRLPHTILWLLLPDATASQYKKDIDEGNSNVSSNASTTATGTSPIILLSKQNEMVISKLRNEARSQGINPQRIYFAERVSKHEHILRHHAADLFLDTLTYGAHSTAMDALRGGLPVLTILGDSFPSRVGASLYANLVVTSPELPQLFVVDSVMAFEDTAVKLLRSLFPFINNNQRSQSLVPPNKSSESTRRPLLSNYFALLKSQKLLKKELNSDLFSGSSAFSGLSAALKFVRAMLSVAEVEAITEYRRDIFASLPHLFLVDIEP